MNAGHLLPTVVEKHAGRIAGDNCGSEKATVRTSSKESTECLRSRNGAHHRNRTLDKTRNSDSWPRRCSSSSGEYHCSGNVPSADACLNCSYPGLVEGLSRIGIGISAFDSNLCAKAATCRNNRLCSAKNRSEPVLRKKNATRYAASFSSRSS
jgi:hypothetical protein